MPEQIDLKTRLKDVGLEDFEKIVKEMDRVSKSPVCEKAVKEAGVNISSLIKHVKEENADYSIRSGIDIARRDIRDATEMALATETTCYFLGMKDRPGTKYPCRVALLKITGSSEKKGSKAKLFEASSFDPKFELPNGEKVLLEEPGEVTLKIKENTKFDSLEIVQLVKYRKMSGEEMAKILSTVQNDPRKYTFDDKYVPIILSGEIRGVYPVNILEKNEEEEWVVKGAYPVLVKNQLEENPVTTPVLKIELDPVLGVIPRITFEARRYTSPIVLVEDMVMSVHRAFRDIKDPKEQAAAVSDLIRQRTVIIVGSVTKVSSGKTEKSPTYMEISAYSIFDAPFGVDWLGVAGQGEEEKVFKAPVETPASVPSESREASKKEPREETEKKGKGGKKKDEPAGPAAGSPPATKFADVMAAVKEYCSTTGVAPKDLTVDIVQAQVCPSAKKGIITAVLDELS